MSRLPFQGKPLLLRAPATIPAVVGEAAWQGYAALGFGDQSCARIHERGGFGLAEIAQFLIVAVDAGLVEIRLTDKARPS